MEDSRPRSTSRDTIPARDKNIVLHTVPSLGKHTLLEFYDCESETLRTSEKVRQIMLAAARKGKATIVQDVFHQFSPHGVSGVVVISESHFAIHTWPEYGYAAVDLFTCTQTIQVDEIEIYLRTAFNSRQVERVEILRGRLPSN